eukprot:SAG11_NODE_28064_length_325_cov_10.796460_1_plen_52_part_10
MVFSCAVWTLGSLLETCDGSTDHQAGGENVQKGGCPCSLPGERVMHIERNIG